MKALQASDIHFKQSGNLEVYLFNVGQGDHIMIKLPNQEYGLIDFFYDCSCNVLEPPALSFFKELKATISAEEFEKVKIAFFCVSHTDKDHVKGLAETVSWFHDNHIQIKDFWLGAARSPEQYSDFLKKNIPKLVDEFDLDERFRFEGSISLYNDKVATFFKYFERWQDNAKKSKANGSGTGEYLEGIKSLRILSRAPDTTAVNIGPLSEHLTDYLKNVTVDLAKKILGILDEKNHIDKNLLSHILRIRFGDTNLIFGGDTEKQIWEDCINRYEDENREYKRHYGELASHFIKVSHHGSKNSSSNEIWEKIIPTTDHVFLGISAGRHGGFKHPHVETIREIKQARVDATILSTNICLECLEKMSNEKEYHVWYDRYVERAGLGHLGGDAPYEVERAFRDAFGKKEVGDLGLFAFVFEVPDNPNKGINVRLALAKANKKQGCFYEGHWHKFVKSCEIEG